LDKKFAYSRLQECSHCFPVIAVRDIPDACCPKPDRGFITVPDTECGVISIDYPEQIHQLMAIEALIIRCKKVSYSLIVLITFLQLLDRHPINLVAAVRVGFDKNYENYITY
jgi:hypothetical protein